MRTRLALVALLWCLAAAAQEKDKPPARLIPVKNLKVTTPEKGGDPRKPAIIASADDLLKSPVVKDAADDLKKQVDFAKEQLVVFAWKGRPKEAVGPTATTTHGERRTVVFTYTQAGTKGTVDQVFLYAVPKDAEVKVEVNPKVPK